MEELRPAEITAATPLPHLRSILRSTVLGRHPPTFGHQVHALVLKAALPLASAIFHFYAGVGPAASSLLSFASIPPPLRSPVDWTALISSQPSAHSLPLFRSMLRAQSPPDEITILSLLSASAQLSDLVSGGAAYVFVVKLGLIVSAKIYNSAIHMYCKCGRIVDGRKLFDEMPQPNVVSWTVLLSGILRWEGLESGRRLFDRMQEKNEVSWTVMIAGYVEAGRPKEAFNLLAQMLLGDFTVRNLNHVSVCSLLSACSQAGNLAFGLLVHTHVVKSGFVEEDLVMVNTALIDMYGKCGRIENARRLFDVMECRNLVAWNAMLSVLSMHGLGSEVLSLFFEMVEKEAQWPDDITLVSVLSACSRSGLVEQGRRIFRDLSVIYGLKPKVDHYACMVDLLGRAGQLEEAESLVRRMHVPPNEVVLGSLLASYGLHGKLELGRKLMHELVQMDPSNTEYHVLLSNLYSSYGRHSEANVLRKEIKKKGSSKGPGFSYIEIDGIMHRFSAGDKSHPQTQAVYAKLYEIVQRLRIAGYSPDAASQVSRAMDSYLENDDEREEREQALLSHSERLAISFGLITTRPGVRLRIFKNLRICNDCHTAIKLISDIYGREIIVRDRNRFHCFKQSVCSCSDYW